MENLKASQEVLDAVTTLKAEIERIWEPAWRFTFDAVQNGVRHPDLTDTLNSNPVLGSLFFEMQHSVHIWLEAGMSVDQIPPVYSVKRTRLESLFVEVVKDAEDQEAKTEGEEETAP